MNLETRKLEADLPGNADEVYCMDFVVDKVASEGQDRTLRMWQECGFSITSIFV